MAVNVLFLHTGGNWIRGSENALLTALSRLDRSKIEPFLFCDSTVLAEAARTAGIETVLCPMPDIMIDGSVRLQFLRWASSLQRLCSFGRKNDIRVVYCNGGRSCQVGYYAAKRLRVPVVCHVHCLYNRRYILLYRLHRASTVIFVSNAVQRSITEKQSFSGMYKVVYNGVDTERFCPPPQRDKKWRAELSISPDCMVFGQVSSLIPRKGIDVLLRAFHLVTETHPKARLVLVGDGPQRAEYSALADQLGVSQRVMFVGDQSDPSVYYRHIFDVNVLASRSDAFPLSLLEAAAAGLPSIGADVDGIGEAVLEGKNGFLFNREDHRMLAAKMSLLASNRNLVSIFGAAGRQLALERFSVDTYSESIQASILDQVRCESRL
ncbi:MAG TPA: glycosyltransferase family 4 protein [Bryobacteraceae bacterium]|nr:glycosyltransferase family 4 protein [Bryobacteraceae bacterium]